MDATLSQTFRSRWSPLILAAALIIAGGAQTPALAADSATCDRYAQGAVRQFEIKQNRVCGPDRNDNPQWWSGDEGYHRRWCLGVTDLSLLSDGTRHRDAVIDRCSPKLQEADCQRYAGEAVAQNQQRLSLNCTSNIGRSDMWSSDREYHARWCRGQTDKNLLEAGKEARANALRSCVPEAAPDFTCNANFGLRQPVNVRKYFNRAKSPGDGGSAACIFEFGNGEEIRAEAHWKQAVSWRVDVSHWVSVGCDATSAGIGSTKTTELGLLVTSSKSHANAQVTGNTPVMRRLAQAALGTLNDMFVLAELNALPCR